MQDVVVVDDVMEADLAAKKAPVEPEPPKRKPKQRELQRWFAQRDGKEYSPLGFVERERYRRLAVAALKVVEQA